MYHFQHRLDCLSPAHCPETILYGTISSTLGYSVHLKLQNTTCLHPLGAIRLLSVHKHGSGLVLLNQYNNMPGGCQILEKMDFYRNARWMWQQAIGLSL